VKQIRYHEESDPFVALNVIVNVEGEGVALRLTWFGR
jgi:hypothetical protein